MTANPINHDLLRVWPQGHRTRWECTCGAVGTGEGRYTGVASDLWQKHLTPDELAAWQRWIFARVDASVGNAESSRLAMRINQPDGGWADFDIQRSPEGGFTLYVVWKRHGQKRATNVWVGMSADDAIGLANLLHEARYDFAGKARDQSHWRHASAWL